MTGMSLLRPCATQGFRMAFSNGKPVVTPLLRQTQLQGKVSVRNGGHEQKMIIRPSEFEWRRFTNDLHFYLLLGLIPMFSIIAYANIFIGPAELSDIPEGYEPKEWEYYQSPIKRWFAKYVYEEPQKQYEKTLAMLHKSREERYWNLLEKKVASLQSNRQDYKGWYWVNADKSLVEAEKEGKELLHKYQYGGSK